MAKIIGITSLTEPGVELFSTLTEAQLRNKVEPQKGIFIAESPKVIQVALNAGCEPQALLCERRHIDGDAKSIIAQCGEIPVYTGDRALLEQLTGYTLTRGVLCAMRRPAEQSASELLQALTNSDTSHRQKRIVVIDGVVLVPWTWLDHYDTLHDYGFKTAAMALTDQSVSIDDVTVASEVRLAIIMGTEGDGLPQETINGADYVIRIPMAHGVDSLNVAAAAAVAFWQLRAKE